MTILDDTAQLAQTDQGQMLAFVHRLPEMSQAAFQRGSQAKLPTTAPRQILICGMGGSAISGDLARTLLFGASQIPVMVARHCELPAWVDADTLIVLMSYSGNTAETLGCLRAAVDRKCPLVLVTCGGIFGTIASEHQLTVVPLEAGWSPRAALGELYFALLGVLSQIPACHVPAHAAQYAIAQLRSDRDRYVPEVPLAENPAKQLAASLSGATPLVFGVSPTTEAVALRWKCQLNENSKQTVLFNLFPELTHNEIVNLAHGPAAAPMAAVILRDPEDPALLQAQLNIALDIMKANFASVTELTGKGDDLLTRQLSLIYLGDYVSVYLALAAGVDPTPVAAISQLKARMSASGSPRTAS